MTSIVINILKTIAVNLFTKTFGVWLLKLGAKTTSTKVDDNMVLLIEAGLKNDSKGIEEAAKLILLDISNKYIKE